MSSSRSSHFIRAPDAVVKAATPGLGAALLGGAPGLGDPERVDLLLEPGERVAPVRRLAVALHERDADEEQRLPRAGLAPPARTDVVVSSVGT